MENETKTETKSTTSKPTITNKELSKILDKNPTWILTHLSLNSLDNVIESAKNLISSKVDKERKDRAKQDLEAQKILDKYNK